MTERGFPYIFQIDAWFHDLNWNHRIQASQAVNNFAPIFAFCAGVGIVVFLYSLKDPARSNWSTNLV